MDKATEKYGSPIRLWLGPELVVLISDAENVEIVLKSKDCLNKPHSFYKIIQDAMQIDGFFTLKGSRVIIAEKLLTTSEKLDKKVS